MRDPRILYVDDEVELTFLASAFFEDEGMALDVCHGFKEALEKIRSSSYDVIISDATMPMGSGEKLLKIIQSEGIFQGKFILVTGHDHNISEGHSYDFVMLKPLCFQTLVDKVKGYLDDL